MIWWLRRTGNLNMLCSVYGCAISDKIYKVTKLLYHPRCKGLHTKGRPPGGARPLNDPSIVFSFNNWDNVEWTENQEKEAEEKVKQNSLAVVAPELQEKYENDANKYWDEFYSQHQNRFFKDRHWLFTEFPELAPEYAKNIPSRAEADTHVLPKSEYEKAEFGHVKSVAQMQDKLLEGSHSDTSSTCHMSTNQHMEHEDHSERLDSYPGCQATYRIFEVGCGVGNTVFPVLQTNNNPALFVYCCDLSKSAIQLVQKHPDYTRERCHAFVCDITAPGNCLPFPENSLDIAVLIFVLSAINPDKMQSVVDRLVRHLKPGGLLVFRDYGLYDMAQLRFKNGKCLSKNFYVRGDGTRVYFFTQEELHEIFTTAGLEKRQNYIDRRLQVNRSRQLRMYRVWIQCKYYKPLQQS